MKRRSARRRLAMAIVALAAVGAEPAAAGVELRADGLRPAFAPSIRDYVVDCAEPIRLEVAPSGGGEARIDRGAWFGAARARRLDLAAGEAVRVDVRDRAAAYSIRCLPGDFPAYEFERSARPGSPFYLVTPEAERDARYVAVFDRHGVPVWWFRAPTIPFDAKVLADGTFVWGRRYGGPFNVDPDGAYEFRRVDGRRLGLLRTVGSPTDNHDLQPTPDGNYLVLTYRGRDAVDASAFNGDADAAVFDGVVQKLTPGGRLLWEWSSQGRIGLDETGRWWSTLGEPYDVVHPNALHPLPGGDFLVSMRNTDAIYRVDRPSGRILWKLGGTATERSLAVAADPLGDYPLGGPHDVRSRDGTSITVFDNGTGLGRAPRAARYRIDVATATLTAELADPEVDAAPYTGSARLAGGRWLVSWGGHPLVAEYSTDGGRVFGLRFEAAYSYRAVAIDGEVTRGELRRGMDAMASR